jgi:hypothetical protein
MFDQGFAVASTGFYLIAATEPHVTKRKSASSWFRNSAI